MLALFRILLAGFWIFPSLLVTLVACFLRPFSSDNIYLFATLWGPPVAWVFNVKFILRRHELLSQERPCLVLANHQTNWDLLVASIFRIRRTVSLGKIEILYIPIFGLFYWLSGNIAINRKNRTKAKKSMQDVKALITKKRLAILIMPEGTRSHGRGLGPFKRGAFYTAKEVNVPMYPLCISNWHEFVNLNRWKAGTVIIEAIDPIPPSVFNHQEIDQVIESTRQMMLEKINQLNAELRAKK
jgi:1-acyl-sn-glycerol-3-phosphate acyltransferase